MTRSIPRDLARVVADGARSARVDRDVRAFEAATSSLAESIAYKGLHPYSLAISSANLVNTPASINLVLPQLSRNAIFAGIRTALEFGLRTAALNGLPIRLIALTGHLSGRERTQIASYIQNEFGHLAHNLVQVLSSAELRRATIGTSDLWIATHWTTAHSLDVAAKLGLLNRESVTYLVQDYEPGFSAWSTDFAIARSTYHADFRMVINSLPLARYLSREESIAVDRGMIFRPQLDLDRLEETWRRRMNRGGTTPSVLFYARPDKPRNLYSLGMATLSLLAVRGRGETVDIRTAGAHHSKPDGPLARSLRVLGHLSWESYFEWLARSDVVLSLQHSPHPSHPPLDSVVSGGFSVTNELGGTRSGMHPRLRAVEPEPEALCEAVAAGLDEARGGDRFGSFDLGLLEKLGLPFDTVVEHVSSEIAL